MDSKQDVQSTPRLFTVRQFAERHPAFPAAGLRDYIFRASDRVNSRGERIAGNGLEVSGALVRVGRKVLISEEHFFRWLVEQQHKSHLKQERQQRREHHAAAV